LGAAAVFHAGSGGRDSRGRPQSRPLTRPPPAPALLRSPPVWELPRVLVTLRLRSQVDLVETRSSRGAFMSRCEQAAAAPAVPRVAVQFRLCDPSPALFPSPPVAVRIHEPMEEIALGPGPARRPAPRAWRPGRLEATCKNSFILFLKF
jgi:hypothetical protein